MKIFATCMECQKELGRPSFEVFNVPYYEDRLSVIECAYGHTSVHVLQNQKFEVLMESGANALAAGFTLEACASFSAALERLYEFAIKVFVIKRGIAETDFERQFKEMARQSERQLGAFMVLYLIEIGTPYIINNDLVNFRNAVIHKGKIPDPGEAHSFCSDVYDSVVKITDELKQRCPEAMRRAVLLDMQERDKKLPQKYARAFSSGGLMFDLSADNKRTFEEALNFMNERIEILKKSLPQMEALSRFHRSYQQTTAEKEGDS